jgi:hypothetical protein
MNNALLPSGLMDTLPPHSAQEFRLIHRFLKHFMAFGYEPVTPPLLEHAETMLSGLSEEAATRYFQVTACRYHQPDRAHCRHHTCGQSAPAAPVLCRPARMHRGACPAIAPPTYANWHRIYWCY